MTPADLRTWRTERHLSQAKLADQLGVHWTTVQRWERAERDIPPFLALALESLERRIIARPVMHSINFSSGDAS